MLVSCCVTFFSSTLSDLAMVEYLYHIHMHILPLYTTAVLPLGLGSLSGLSVDHSLRMPSTS